MDSTDYQRRLQAMITDPNSLSLEEQARLAAELEHADRLSVYNHGYRARIHEALVDVYPTLAYYLGSDDFFALADEYAASYRSTVSELTEVGELLFGFMSRHRLCNACEPLVELARVEWQASLAFHAKEYPPLALSELTKILQNQALTTKLKLQPYAKVVSSEWAIADLWFGAKQQTLEFIPDRVWIESLRRSQHLVFSRFDYQLRTLPVSALQAQFISAFASGCTVNDACLQLEHQLGTEDVVPVHEWLLLMVQEALLCENFGDKA